jgi:hypothetical protein
MRGREGALPALCAPVYKKLQLRKTWATTGPIGCKAVRTLLLKWSLNDSRKAEAVSPCFPPLEQVPDRDDSAADFSPGLVPGVLLWRRLKTLQIHNRLML